MMQSRLEANRIIRQWEDMMENPVDYAPICDCCGNPIDEIYCISDRVLDEDCAKAMYRSYVIDEPTICCVCEDDLTDEYFDVNGDAYCERCFDRQFME